MLYIVKQIPKGRGKEFRITTVQVVEAETKKAAIAQVLERAVNDFSEHPTTLEVYCRLQAEPLQLGTTYRF